MTSFAHLFPSGPRRQEESGVFDDHHTVRRLREMIGDPRDEIDMASPRSGARLAQLVAEAKANPAPALAWAPVATGKRPRRRVDVLSAAAASLAIVALAAAGIVAGVQAASADPAGSAMVSLRADEESIQSAESALAASRERLHGRLTTTTADAAAVRAAVEAAREAPGPDAARAEESVAIVDAVKADEIVAEIDRYTAELQATALPDLPAPYTRAEVDEHSLAEVGAAIGAAQEHISVLDEATVVLRDATSVFDAIEAQHLANLEGIAAGFTELGAAMIDENPDANAELQDAVAAAAAGVVASKLRGAEAAAAVTAYRDAVIALIAGQREADAERPRGNQQQNDRGTTDPGSSDPSPTNPPTEPTAPPEEPTDPIVVIPPGDGDGSTAP